MKSLLIAALVATASLPTLALDVGMRGVYNEGNIPSMAGVTVGQKFGPVGVEGAFDRSTRGPVNVNRWSVLGSYDVVKFGPVTVSAKAGAAFIDPSDSGINGYAAIVGVGASFPVTKRVSLVADYAYQRGQERVSSFNGNSVSAGAKFSF